MLKNLKWATGNLKKVPTVFRLELVDLEFKVEDGYFSMRQHDTNAVISTGTSINIVSVTKRGLAKSSVLKQVQAVGNGELVTRFNESFDFKASLFYDHSGHCNPKTLKLNINRVCRIEDSREYSTTCIGYCIVNLHEVPSAGVGIFRISAVLIDCPESTSGVLVVKIAKFENAAGDMGLDDTSSIGSDLSFMHKEVRGSRSAPSGKKNVHRVVGGAIPEAGKPAKFTAVDHPEIENLLTEISIVKMHLDRAIADKDSAESLCRDVNRECQGLQAELKAARVAAHKQAEDVKEELEGKNRVIAENKIEIDALKKTVGSLSADIVALNDQLNIRQESVVSVENSLLVAELQATKKELAAVTAKYMALAEEVERKRGSVVSSDSGKAIIRTDLFSEPSIADETQVSNRTKREPPQERKTLFSADDVDTTLRAKPTRTVLFNDDVVELLKDHRPPASSHAASTSPQVGGVVSRRGSGTTKKPSLFNDVAT